MRCGKEKDCLCFSFFCVFFCFFFSFLLLKTGKVIDSLSQVLYLKISSSFLHYTHSLLPVKLVSEYHACHAGLIEFNKFIPNPKLR